MSDEGRLAGLLHPSARKKPPTRFDHLAAHLDTRYEKTTTVDIGGVVRERGNDEPNPLLQWAEWDKYLQGCEWADLLALTERPKPCRGAGRIGHLDGDGGGRLYIERDGPPGGLRDPATGHSDPGDRTEGLPAASYQGQAKCNQVRSAVAGHYDVLCPDPAMGTLAAMPGGTTPTHEHYSRVSTFYIKSMSTEVYCRAYRTTVFLFPLAFSCPPSPDVDVDLNRLLATIANGPNTSSRPVKSRRGAV